MTGADAIAILVLLIVVIAIGVYLLHWLYRHSSKDQSFVRTGSGGERVVMGGGALVIPIVHNITLVNMSAVPVEVRRMGEQSLITGNKMRVDVACEFDVRVSPTEEAVSTAARTLGERTGDSSGLREVIQGRLIDAMSAVAARMTMDEMHADRLGYMREVSALIEPTLAKNGLELENAALVVLNQSDISVFDPSNAFDAEGLTQLTEQIESRRKMRNEIENETRVAIKLRDFEAEQREIEIDRDLEYARLEQARDVARRKAEREAEIEEDRANSTIGIQSARVRAEQESERVRIAKEKAIEEERIRSQSTVRILEIQRRQEDEAQAIDTQKALDARRITSEREVAAERIENEKTVREAEIRARQDVQLFEATANAEVDAHRYAQTQQAEASRIEAENAVEVLAVEKSRSLRLTSEAAMAEEERAAIERRRTVDMDRLARDEEVARREIAKGQTLRLAETEARRETEDARIATERTIEEMKIAATRYIERVEIEQSREVEIVDKDRLIAVVNKAIEETGARIEETKARKEHARLEEEVASARAIEIAERAKQIELVEAASRAEADALRITAHAEAQKSAAERRAEAEIAEANAAEVRYEKDADGARKLNEAENLRSEESRRSAIYENLVQSLPNIIRETVKPMENIDSIKILQVDGVPGINSPSEVIDGEAPTGGGGGGNMTDRVANSAMKYRTQVAFVDGLMQELGLPLDKLGSAGGMSFRNFADKDGGRDGTDT